MNTEIQKELYETYYQKVYKYLVFKVNDTYLAEDLCSDIFMKVYEKYESFDSEKASVSTWIYTIARNSLTDYFRGRKVFEEIPETLESGAEDIEDSICRDETLSELATALSRLDERDRDIIILHYYKDYTLKKTAESLGISYAYVKILHNKALAQLKKALPL